MSVTGDNKKVIERRRAKRYEVNHQFQSVDEFLREYAMNVSASGVFIRTEEPLPVGTKVKLRFTVVVDEFETIEGVGVVARSVPAGGSEPAGIGVVFTSLTPHSREVLSRLFVKGGAEESGNND